MRASGMWRRAGRVVGLGLAATALGTMGLVVGGSSAGASSKANGTPLVVGLIETQTNSAECPSCHVLVATDTLKGWAATVNSHGGIDGHPVTLIVLNTTDDPGTAQSDLATLQSRHALAIVGEDASGTEPTWKTTINADKLPVIGGTDYTTAPLTDPLFYGGSTNVIANVWGEWDAMIVAGIKHPKVASLLCSTSTVCVGAESLNAAAAKSLNIPIVYNETAKATAPTYTPQCLAMKAAGANVISPQGVNDATLVTDCKRQGYTPAVITENEDATPSQIKSQSALNGLFGPTPSFIPSATFPQEKAYFAMLKKYDPSLLPGGKQYDSTFDVLGSTDAWVAAQIFEQGIKNADIPAKTAVTRTDLIKGLSMFKTTTLGGISPPLTFSDGTTPNPPQLCFYLYKQTSKFKGTYEPIPKNKMKYYCEPAKDLPT